MIEGDTLIVRVPLPAAAADLVAQRPLQIDAVNYARQLLRLRRQRNAVFDDLELGEPTWDILVDLFVMAAEKRPITVSGACAISGVPATTAFRHVGRLIDQGHVLRIADPHDRRRVFLELAASMRLRLEQLLIKGARSLAETSTQLAARPSDHRQ